MMLRGLGKKAVVTGIALAGAGAACTGAVVAAYAVGRGAKRSASLRGRVAVITGSSRGLGLALAEEFGKRGARLVLTARDSEELERARWLLLR